MPGKQATTTRSATDPAGYSGTPLPKKLGITAGKRVALLHAPDGIEAIIQPMPADVTLRHSLKGTGTFDVIVLFVTTQAALQRDYCRAVERLESSGGLWIAWPKKTSGVVTDLNENLLRELCLPSGLVDNKVCAIDQTWSGLRFVRRIKDR